MIYYNNSSVREKWVDFSHRLGVTRSFSEGVWGLLYNFYQIPPRTYHSLDWHITSMLNNFEDFKRYYPTFTTKWNELEWAIWFHDIYQDPESQHNEYFSMQLAATLSAEHTKLDYYKISHCVLATTHCLNSQRGSQSPAYFGPEEKLICDLDLAGFVAHGVEFRESQNRLRAEYHVSDSDYREARVKFLQSLLGRGYIYLTDECQSGEQRARDRIQGIIEGKYD